MVVPEKCLWCQKTEEDTRTIAELKQRIAELQAALAEAQQTIRKLREGLQ